MDVDDVWDDSALIEMYEQSLKEVNKSRSVAEKKYTGEDGHTYTWKIGSKCMAPYEENGKTSYYAAKIDSIAENDEVEVTFLYYGNTTTTHLKELWIDEAAIAEAETSEKKETAKASSSKSSPSFGAPPPPIPSFAPPVPPNIIAMAPKDQREAMNSMLMSWYMSGYHTGYYQAMADNQQQQNKH
uniref:Tudor domain-containing protein n=1 Tax=Caenorhabditis tropicalis TaxID=1561998 RepID=A0A1I7U4Y8_9PELO